MKKEMTQSKVAGRHLTLCYQDNDIHLYCLQTLILLMPPKHGNTGGAQHPIFCSAVALSLTV